MHRRTHPFPEPAPARSHRLAPLRSGDPPPAPPAADGPASTSRHLVLWSLTSARPASRRPEHRRRFAPPALPGRPAHADRTIPDDGAATGDGRQRGGHGLGGDARGPQDRRAPGRGLWPRSGSGRFRAPARARPGPGRRSAAGWKRPPSVGTPLRRARRHLAQGRRNQPADRSPRRPHGPRRHTRRDQRSVATSPGPVFDDGRGFGGPFGGRRPRFAHRRLEPRCAPCGRPTPIIPSPAIRRSSGADSPAPLGPRRPEVRP